VADVFDLVIIGSGPAGYVGAIRGAQLGMTVACVEKDKTLGGTCLNVGCIPSKALLDSSERYAYAKKNFGKHGILTESLRVDLPAMMKRKEGIVKTFTMGIEGLFKKNKIERVSGMGSVRKGSSSPLEVVVKGEGGEKLLAAKRVLIATGSIPSPLPGFEFDQKRILTSTEALTIPEIPKHLLVVGAGVIGLELGSVWARLGSQVTVIEFGDGICPQMDREVAKEFQKSLEKQGLSFKLSTQCLSAKASSSGVKVEIQDRTSQAKSEVAADYVLVAVGRKPWTSGVGLEALGVKVDARGFIQVNEDYQSSVPGIYAVGDCIPGPMLAHKAEEDAVVAVERMAGQKSHVDYRLVPGVVYTHPEVASVGDTEETLKAQNVEYRSGKFPFMANGRAKAMEESEGFVKILAHAKTDRVLGVHIVGPHASDLIGEAVSVMEFGGSSEDIARTCHAHPTLSEAVKEAALDVAKRRINL
jgi:dihydrolipoamide dehydrogenase